MSSPPPAQSSLRRLPPGAISPGVQTHGPDEVEWRVSNCLVPYPEALAFMEQRAAAIRLGEAPECVWLLEHPPLFTAGTSADPAELFNPLGFPVFEAGRGGRYTYHGPGQRVGYLMLDLERRGKDIRCFVHQLEAWVIATLGDVGVSAHRAPLGIRVRRWVTLHGFSINVAPDLAHFRGIVPCGIAEYGVTSLAELGIEIPLTRVDAVLKRKFGSFLRGLEQPDKVS
jgi:lipoyl(octanoyl) transferase